MVPEETHTEPSVTAPDDSPGPSRVEEIAKLLLGVAGLVVLMALLSIIPPLDRPVPWAPDDVFVTFQTVIAALVTVVVVGLFIVIADELEALVADRLDGPEPLVEDAAAVAKYLLIFLVLVAAYGPLAAVAAPFLAPSDTVWVFDLGFVVVALLPLGVAAYVVAENLDDLAGLLVATVRTAGDRIESGPTGGSSGADVDGRNGTTEDGSAAREDGTESSRQAAEGVAAATPDAPDDVDGDTADAEEE